MTPTQLASIGFKYYPHKTNKTEAVYFKRFDCSNYVNADGELYIAARFIGGKFFYAELRDKMGNPSFAMILGGVVNFEQMEQFHALLTGRDGTVD